MENVDHDEQADGPSLPNEIAVPRQNGELLFEAPWEARAFGLAVALHDEGAFAWKTFSEALSAEIAKAESAGESSGYYERWLRALNRVTTEGNLITTHEVEARSEQVRHDEEHEHDHSHPHE